MRLVKGIRIVIRCGALGAAALVVAASFAGCGKNAGAQGHTVEKKSDSAVVKVVVATVAERPFEDWGSYSADLRGVEDAVLTAPAQGGRVTAVKPVGTRFAAGDALCDIDSDKYEAAFEAAKAQVEMTRGDLDRTKANVENGSLGRSAIDGANLAYQNARMMLATAKRAYEDCHCQAQFAGVLVSRTVEKYQTVAPGTPTMRLSRIDQLEAVIALPESEAFNYHIGMKTEFRLLQKPDQAFEGQVSSIDQAVDAKSRTVSARIVVLNKNGILRPGMVGRANILRHKYEKAIVIPSTALLHLENGLAVMIAENGVALQHIVKAGATAGDSTLITDGIAADDKLIVTGAFQVSDGTRVSY
jgi:membrane fusion protein (multidrug efflux system)